MLRLITQEWHEQLTLTRTLVTPGDRNAFYSRVHRGEYMAVCRGVYVEREVWELANADDRYRLKINAVAALSKQPLVLSHLSAAALWRLPLVGRWPARVHVTTTQEKDGLSTRMIARHALGIPHSTAAIEGLTVTSLARTVVDASAMCSFGAAVAMADAALRRAKHPVAGVPPSTVTAADLSRAAAGRPMRHSTAKIRRVIDFADGAADRPGESLSRVNMSAAGLAVPQLQVPLRGASGRQYFVDFWWPEFGVIGEFDGKDKYRNPDLLSGKTTADAHHDEKVREDDLRAAGHGLCRWGWQTAISTRLLAETLSRAGVR